MDAQQLHDYIIEPTLKQMNYLGGNYNTKESRFLLLCTAAIESNCGHYIKQIEGPALGIWQMEPNTYIDIWNNSDAIHQLCVENLLSQTTDNFYIESKGVTNEMVYNPRYSCAMARLKYAMDIKQLPSLPESGVKGLMATDAYIYFSYYKRIYNTEIGASTFGKWIGALNRNGIWNVELGE